MPDFYTSVRMVILILRNFIHQCLMLAHLLCYEDLDGTKNKNSPYIKYLNACKEKLQICFLKLRLCSSDLLLYVPA